MVTNEARKKFAAIPYPAVDILGQMVEASLKDVSPDLYEFFDTSIAAGNEIIEELECRNQKLSEKLRRYRLQLKQLNRAHIVQKRLLERLQQEHAAKVPAGVNIDGERRSWGNG
jgi:hypothetical protein